MITYTGIVIASETRGDASDNISAFLVAFDDPTKSHRSSDYYTASGIVGRTMRRAWAKNRSVSVDVENGKVHNATLI